MALIKSCISPHGFDAENAYHNIEITGINKIDGTIDFIVRTWKDSSKSFQYWVYGSYSIKYNMNSGNLWEQAYMWLKSEIMIDAKDD